MAGGMAQSIHYRGIARRSTLRTGHFDPQKSAVGIFWIQDRASPKQGLENANIPPQTRTLGAEPRASHFVSD